MLKFNLKIWANYTGFLASLAWTGSFGEYWLGSAGATSQRRAMFSMA